MRKVLLSTAILLTVAGISAKEVTQQTAREAASSFAAALSPLRATSGVELVYTAGTGSVDGLRQSGYPLFYVYNVGRENGFVVIAGDDTAYPVLGYADAGTFRADSMPGNLSAWLSFYEGEIAAQIASGGKVSDETVQAWRKLLTDSPDTPSLGASYTTASWDQLEPYNNLCPRDNGKATYAGCVATGMGIIMKYHQWPSKGTGSFDYLTDTKSIRVTATLGDTYNWGNMADAYTRSPGGVPQWTDAQGAEVAKLIFHCGAASYTDFTADFGAAYPSDAFYAFVNNFGYDIGAYLAFRELYTVAEWDSILQRELDDERIIFYNGNSESAGHQFILDGYNSMNYYHVNWGWSGYANGYFRLTALDPTGGNSGYVYDQGALIGLQKPVEGSVPRYEFFYFDHSLLTFLGLRTDDAIITSGKPFSLYISAFSDYGFRDFTGYVSLCLTDRTGVVKETLEPLELVELEGGDAMSDLEGDTYTITSPIAEGDVVQMMYSLDGVTWMKVRGVPGAVTELPVGVNLTSNEMPVCDETISVLFASVTNGISIRSTTQELPHDIRLYDPSGRMVKRFRLTDGETSVVLPVEDLRPGIYFLTVGTDEGSSRFKVNVR